MAGALGLPSLLGPLVQACLRCTLQLYLAGGFLLTHLLSSQSTPLLCLWILGTGLLAGTEAAGRVQYTFPNLRRYLVCSLLTGGITVLGLAYALQLLGPTTSPRVWIPVSGMLFGNTLTAVSLAASTLTNELVTHADAVEWRLCRGATAPEALQPLREATAFAALTPALNMLRVAGIIHIPGMMTGQILAGQPPYQAAAYQVLIFCLIATTACISVQTLLACSLRELGGDRLVREQIVPVDKTNKKANWKRWLPSFLFEGPVASNESAVSRRAQNVSLDWHASDESPILVVQDLPVERTNMTVALELHPEDRLGIQGPSGVGKSQILRTLAGLEPMMRNSVWLTKHPSIELPTWRRRVALVPQDRPSLEGTPRESFDAVCNYRSHDKPRCDPSDLVSAWGLDPSALDQPWSTLSGGEAQRASLAIAMALDPDVLLLDESTSALDEPSTLLVEKTIREWRLPVIMVSHSQTQLDRFCNHRIELVE